MKRKITELEQKLINDGWCLAIKRYTGKHSEKILHYEYHKKSDLRNDGKFFDLFINLDQKRSQIVKYGVLNLTIHQMSEDELTVVRFVFLELRHYVERLTKVDQPQVNVPNSELDEREELAPMTPEQFDELCKEHEWYAAL